MVPISLLTAMIDTTSTESSSVASSASKSMSPVSNTGMLSITNPFCSAKARVAASTHLCSMGLTKMRLRPSGARPASPNSAKLFASVAPEVKITSSASEPISLATSSAALDTTFAAFQPTAWSLECGLPNCPFQ